MLCIRTRTQSESSSFLLISFSLVLRLVVADECRMEGLLTEDDIDSEILDGFYAVEDRLGVHC